LLVERRGRLALGQLFDSVRTSDSPLPRFNCSLRLVCRELYRQRQQSACCGPSPRWPVRPICCPSSSRSGPAGQRRFAVTEGRHFGRICDARSGHSTWGADRVYHLDEEDRAVRAASGRSRSRRDIAGANRKLAVYQIVHKVAADWALLEAQTSTLGGANPLIPLNAGTALKEPSTRPTGFVELLP
jgi:hypothetical protein